MIVRGNKNKETYPEIQRYYKAREVKCTIRNENGFCSLTYDGYIKGVYSDKNLAKIFDCFTKVMEELPATVSLNLENKITEMDEHHSLLLTAVETMNRQRESFLQTLNPTLKKLF